MSARWTPAEDEVLYSIYGLCLGEALAKRFRALAQTDRSLAAIRARAHAGTSTRGDVLALIAEIERLRAAGEVILLRYSDPSICRTYPAPGGEAKI